MRSAEISRCSLFNFRRQGAPIRLLRCDSTRPQLIVFWCFAPVVFKNWSPPPPRALRGEPHGAFTESSKVMSTLTVFPGATSIGCGVGGCLLYIPSDEPEGGGDWASQLPVGS